MSRERDDDSLGCTLKITRLLPNTSVRSSPSCVHTRHGTCSCSHSSARALPASLHPLPRDEKRY